MVWAGTWDGGRVMVTGAGVRRWVLVRMVGGRRYSFTLGVTSEEDARAELALWNRDPAAYIETRRRGKARLRAMGEGDLRVDPTHLELLERRLKARKRSPRHIKDVLRYARVWQAELGRVDLRHVPKARLVAILDRHAPEEQPAKRNKMVVALKAYCRALEAKGLLDPAEAPDRWLSVERATPARLHETRHHEPAVLEAVYAAVAPLAMRNAHGGGRPPEPDQDQAVRDAMRLQVCYGLHATEVARLAACSPETAVRPVEHATIAGVVSFYHHKKRAWHHVSVDAAAWDAVQRLRARKAAPRDGCMGRYLRAASDAAGVERVRPGQLRHSFVTLARQRGRLVTAADGGLDLEQVAAVTGHKSTATTADYYDATVVKPMVVVPLSLVSPRDPS